MVYNATEIHSYGLVQLTTLYLHKIDITDLVLLIIQQHTHCREHLLQFLHELHILLLCGTGMNE